MMRRVKRIRTPQLLQDNELVIDRMKHFHSSRRQQRAHTNPWPPRDRAIAVREENIERKLSQYLCEVS